MAAENETLTRHDGRWQPVVATLAAVLPLGATALWLQAHWAEIPERWPRHWDALGQVNGWGTRSAGSVGMPLVMGAGVVVLVAVLGVAMGSSQAAGGAAKGSAAHAWMVRRGGWARAGVAWLLALLFCRLAVLPLVAAGQTAAQQLHQVLLAVGVFLLALLAVIVVAFRGAPAEAAGVPTRVWYAGVFYYNRANAALLVPKRLGGGWTLNMAHPAAWWLMGGLLVVVLAAPLLVGLGVH